MLAGEQLSEGQLVGHSMTSIRLHMISHDYSSSTSRPLRVHTLPTLHA